MASEKKAPDWMKVNDDGTVTVTLKCPLEISGAMVGYVTMREPTLDDHIAAETVKGSELTKERALMANLCEVAPSDFGRIKVRDWQRIQAAYTANFFD